MAFARTRNGAPEMAFAGACWPGRFPGAWPEGSPLATAMATASPLYWQLGSRPGKSASLFVIWPDLGKTVKRFLDLIPLNPPPDR